MEHRLNITEFNERKAAKAQLKADGAPSQSIPALVDRVVLLEKALGIN